MTADETQSAHLVELAKELLEDVELSRCSTEALVLKASRLARLLEVPELNSWLYYERFGYNSSEELSLKYIGLTGRWTDYEKKIAYWGPISQQEGVLESHKAEMEVIKNFTPSGTYSLLQLHQQQERLSQVAAKVMQMTGIISRVKALVQNMAVQVYQEKVFSGQAETIFENYRKQVDGLLATRAGDAFEKIPHIFRRLSEGDVEAISQALLTCRRVLDSFANSVYPPGDSTDLLGGKEVQVGSQHVKNRLKIYVEKRIKSRSRKEKIFKIISFLYDRVSAGVHDDVDIEEAKAIVLQTYLLLGEILLLGDVPVLEKNFSPLPEKSATLGRS